MPTSRPLRHLLGVLALLVSASLLPAAPASARLHTRSHLSGGDRDVGPPVLLPQTVVADGGITWSDVPAQHWAKTAINYVGATNEWMRDFKEATDGTYAFKPELLETRKFFARAVVRAFAPNEAPDPSITFTDLAAADKFYGFANVAVKLGWMSADGDAFAPDDPVTTMMVHRALVLALGLAAEAAGLDNLHTASGYTFATPSDFGTTLLGIRLGLRYNHSDESLDVGPATPLPRSEVAWSLYRAATASSWMVDALKPYANIKLPGLAPKKQAIVEFGAQYVGYPYVYAGDWAEPTPTGYCCGPQPVGGFDCSGLTWWVVKAAENGWDNQPPRSYKGWSLPQRSSRDMAAVGNALAFDDIKAGDLLFYDGNDDGTVDHVNVYIGNGWALDSSSSYAGVSILKVDSGWYRDHFVHARRIMAVA